MSAVTNKSQSGKAQPGKTESGKSGAGKPEAAVPGKAVAAANDSADVESGDAKGSERSYRKIVQLHFPAEIANKPLVCDLVRRFDITFSILKSNVNPKREGYLTLRIDGTQENCLQGLDYLRGQGVNVTFVAQRIERDETSCMHCGMCTAVCPVTALSNDREARMVVFDSERCIGCGVCVKVCPVKAMHAETNDE